jgi:hypothetical protein
MSPRAWAYGPHASATITAVVVALVLTVRSTR